MLVEFLLFVTSVIGLTHIVVDGKVFQPIRDFFDRTFPKYISDAIHCYQCSGFWCGIICGSIFFTTSVDEWYILIGYLLGSGWSGSFLANFSAMYFNYLEAITVINLPDDDK